MISTTKTYVVFSIEDYVIVKTGAMAAKVVAHAAKHVLMNSCSQGGIDMKLCSKQFIEELGHNKVYILTERAKDIAHRIGQDLFKGKTPIGERLSEVKIKEYPGSFLTKGIDDNEFVNFAEHLVTTKFIF